MYSKPASRPLPPASGYLLAIVIAIAGCGRQPDTQLSGPAAERADLVASGHAQSALRVERGWFRPPIAGRDVSSGYLALANTSGGAIQLLSFKSPQVRNIELHEHRHVDGMMQMRRVGPLTLEAGGRLLMQPGGHHLMLFGLQPDAASGAEISLQISYDIDGDVKTLRASLDARDSSQTSVRD